MESGSNSRGHTPTNERPTPTGDSIFAVPKNLKGMLAVFVMLSIVILPMCLVWQKPLIYAAFAALIGVVIYLYVRVDKSAQAQAQVMRRTMSQEQILQKVQSNPHSVDPHVRSRVMRMMNK